MTEPGDDAGDLHGLTTGASRPQPVEPAKRIPLWKLEEMANGGAASPDGWRGNTGPLLSGWEAAQVHTSSPVRDVRRRRPWPVRAGLALGRWVLVTAAYLMIGALVIGGILSINGGLNLPALLAQATGHAPAAATPFTPIFPAAPAAPADPAAPAAPPAPPGDIPSGATTRTRERPPHAGGGGEPLPAG